MQCSNCGKCCEKTMMELSSKDIERLEEAGYRLEEFAVLDDGVTQLKNVDGWCYLYPVVYLINEGAIVDESCPMGHTISGHELQMKGKILNKLLKKIDNESARNRFQLSKS